MLEQAAGLSPHALDAIAELEQRVTEADGDRLKLEWRRLRARPGDRVEDLLWWEDGRLLGFLGFYSYGAAVELAGMVAPEARRRGIATALLDNAGPLCRDRGIREALLIVPRQSVAGKCLALGRGGALHHSEHALVLAGDTARRAHDPAIGLRTATPADLPRLSQLIQTAFGELGPDDLAEHLDSPQARTLIIELEAAAVGTLRITRDGNDARVYGFAVDPAWQGRGIGREALSRACEELRATGVQRIGLEVAVDNDRALGLYTSVGFTPVTTEDYYALPVS